VQGYIKRLATSGLAYQASSLVAGFLALFTLPLYTRHLTQAQLGYAETLLTAIILVSIVVRFGVGEAFVRFYFDDDDVLRRDRLARRTTSFVLVTSTIAALVAVAFAGPLAQALLRTRDATLMAYGVLGLWAFTNLEIAYALLRVDERRRTYLVASVSNVVLTVALTLTLVVGFDGGARGYVLGNYAASTVVLVGLWAFALRHRIGLDLRAPRTLGPLLRFGAPTVPADAAVFALNVVDRAWLLRADSPATA
jgi:O-antigen/teichoic acid export membrane protein